MKRILLLLACVSTLLFAACTGDSKFPDATGKGAVRAINAIPGGPEVGFLIEERSLGGITYKNSTSPAEYDDFSYNFNFDIANPGAAAITRIATETLQVEAGRDHILMLSGDINAPTITVWSGDIRTFDAADTVLEARFANASPTLGAVDVYFEAPGIVPGTNPPAATLAFGEISVAADFAEGSFVMTVTAAGDPGTVHFTSRETALLPQFAHVVTIFDGNENDTAPVLVRSMTSVGNPLTLVDANFPPQVRYVHGASTLPIVDIYDDELLTSLVVAGLDFREATPDLDAVFADDTKTFYFTPANSTATILFEQSFSAPSPGTFSQIYALGDTDAWAAVRVIPEKAQTINAARIRLFHAAFNNPIIDAYVVDRDAGLTDDDLPAFVFGGYGFVAPPIVRPAGNFDLYLTVRGEKTVIAGPYQFDATLGSNIDLLLVDTVDPLTAEIVDITLP